MKRIIVMLLSFLVAAVGMAQSPADEVTLTVTGDGATKEDATNSALRSAIAQAYGVFVSANTQILNDELVKDEIATITSGNIKEYKEIASLDMPYGRKEVTVQATVSISKLISYSQSKGAESEFAGATFARNLKIKELNKENEIAAMENLFQQIALSLPMCYTRQLNVKEPRMGEQGILIPMEIVYEPNDNFGNLIGVIKRTLDALSLTNTEVKEYNQQNIPVYEFALMTEFRYQTMYGCRGKEYRYYLRHDPQQSLEFLSRQFNYYFCSFTLEDNTGCTSKFFGTWYNDRQRNCSDDKGFPVHIREKTGLLCSCISEEWNTRSEIESWKVVNVTGLPRVLGRALCLIATVENDISYSGRVRYKKLAPTVKFSITIPQEEISKYSSFTIKD